MRSRFIFGGASSLNNLNHKSFEGFVCISPFANKHFGCFLKDDSKGLTLSTSREILGRERSRRPMRSRKAHVQRKEVDQALDFSELVDGDYLVHHQHGICRFCQMGKIEDAETQ